MCAKYEVSMINHVARSRWTIHDCTGPYAFMPNELRRSTPKAAGVAQSVEHWALGCKVLASNLASASHLGSDIGWSL